jgi:transposase-like protein
VIQSKPECCPFCDGRQIIKRGLRRNSYRHLQIYWCRDCGKYFSPLAGIKCVKYPPRLIARVLCLYNLGYSEQQTAHRIAAESRITIPRRTLSDWIAGSRPITTFHRLRSAAVHLFSQAMLKERTLEHQQIYQYKVHLAKLEFAVDVLPSHVVAKLRGYLFSVFEGDFPDQLFEANASQADMENGERSNGASLRSSKSNFETLPLSPRAMQNLANDLAALGLLMARRNKDRHPCVQDFMLANDACTIACEVPVYLTSEEIAYYKSAGFFVDLPTSAKPITGHIDVVQVRNGLIHLLDYKPKAATIDPVNQLLVYALALASRTRLPVKLFKCAWFDEKDYFEFFPLQAVRAKQSSAFLRRDGAGCLPSSVSALQAQARYPREPRSLGV